MGLFDNVVFDPEFALVPPDCSSAPWQTKDIMHFEDRHYVPCEFRVGAEGRLRRTAEEGWPSTCDYSGELDLVRDDPLPRRTSAEEITLQVLNGVVTRVVSLTPYTPLGEGWRPT